VKAVQLPAAVLKLVSDAEGRPAGEDQVRIRLSRQPRLVVRCLSGTAQRPDPDRAVAGNRVTEVAHGLSVPLRLPERDQPQELEHTSTTGSIRLQVMGGGVRPDRYPREFRLLGTVMPPHLKPSHSG
jgi:hypothetical protein